MGSLYKRGKVWYIDIRVKGRRIRRRIGSSRKVAELALKDAEVKAARDELGFGKTDIAIEKFIEKFEDYSRINHTLATSKRYRAVVAHFRKFLKEHTTAGFLSDITSELIDQYKALRRDSPINPNGLPVKLDLDANSSARHGARAHTVNFEVSTLGTIFNLAIKWGYLKENPVRAVKKLKPSDSKPLRFLTAEECRRFLDASPPDLYPIYFTYLNTGMRKAELENLEWSDVDLKRKKLRIRRKEFRQPKTGERDIPINKQLHDLLTKLKAENDGLKSKAESGQPVRSNFVFPDRQTGGKIKTKLRRRLILIAKQADIENLTKIHTLRHTFASHLVMNGVDLPTVKKLMGHSDIQTTMIYAHLAPDHLAGAVDKLKF
jgi:site-specific recombinase XerD